VSSVGREPPTSDPLTLGVLTPDCARWSTQGDAHAYYHKSPLKCASANSQLVVVRHAPAISIDSITLIE